MHHFMQEKDWSATAPNKPGWYWFYGDISMWSMGGHYFEKDPIPPNAKLHLVDVHKISNGMMAAAEGRFVSLTPFDKRKRREGYLGYWAPAELPEPPEDRHEYFKDL